MNYGDGKSLTLHMAWSPDSRTINFVTDSDGNRSLWRQGIDEDQPRFIADLGKEGIRDLLVMSDGSLASIRGNGSTMASW